MVIAWLWLLSIVSAADAPPDAADVSPKNVAEQVRAVTESGEVSSTRSPTDQSAENLPASETRGKLPRKVRARLFLLLAMLVFVGGGLIAFVWILGRATRRYLASLSVKRPQRSADEDDWARKPIVPPHSDS